MRVAEQLLAKRSTAEITPSRQEKTPITDGIRMI